MTIRRAHLSILFLASLIVSTTTSHAAEAGSWDGSWNGTIGKIHPWPISISITNGKVVSFIEKGTPFDVQFTEVTPTTLMFGDPKHYAMKLTKTGDSTASAKIQGRHGVGIGSLTKS